MTGSGSLRFAACLLLLCCLTPSAGEERPTACKPLLQETATTDTDGAVMDVIISLGWEAVTVVHDSPDTHPQDSLAARLHAQGVYTTVYQTAGTLPHTFLLRQQGGVQGFVLVLGSYAFVHQVFVEVARVSNATDKTLVWSHWLTVIEEEELEVFSSLVAPFHNLLVIVRQRTGGQTLWATSHEHDGHLTFMTSLPVPAPVTLESATPGLSRGLSGQHLTVVVKEWIFMLWSTEVNGETVYHGVVMDILKELSHRLNFSYTIVPSPDDSWGQELDNGQWDGPIGMLTRGEADLAAGFFTITADRSAVADPTTPYTYDTSVIVFRRDSSAGGDNWTFLLQPFMADVYGLIGVCFMAVLLLLLLLKEAARCRRQDDRAEDSPAAARHGEGRTCTGSTVAQRVMLSCEVLVAGLLARPHDHQFLTYVPEGRVLLVSWLLLGLLLASTYSTHDHQFLTNVPEGRVLLVSWLLLGLLLASTYSSQLTSSLAVTDHALPFQSLAQLIGQDVYTWGVTVGTSQHSMLKDSGIKEYRTFYEKTLEFAKDDPEVLSTDVEVHKAKVIRGNYAVFLGSTATAESWLAESCDLTFLPESFRTSALGFYLQKHSPYTKAISNEIGRMVDSGLVNYWKRKWSQAKKHCDPEAAKVSRVIGLNDLQAAFTLAGLGLGMAGLVLLFERWMAITGRGCGSLAESL